MRSRATLLWRESVCCATDTPCTLPTYSILVMRLGKPLEHLQAALKAATAPGPAIEQLTTIGRQLVYFGYLSNDALVWVRPKISVSLRFKTYGLAHNTSRQMQLNSGI